MTTEDNPYASPQGPTSGPASPTPPASLWTRLGCAGALFGFGVFWLVAVFFGIVANAGQTPGFELIGVAGIAIAAVAGVVAMGRFFYVSTDQGDLRKAILRTIAWSVVLAVGFPLALVVAVAIVCAPYL